MEANKVSLKAFDKTKSVLLIDYNEIDLFVNQKILENYGIDNICCMRGASDALMHLRLHDIYYSLILIDIYLPFSDGFKFIDTVREFDSNKKQGEICIVSNSIDPKHWEKAKSRNIKFIEKPLTIEKLFSA